MGEERAEKKEGLGGERVVMSERGRWVRGRERVG